MRGIFKRNGRQYLRLNHNECATVGELYAVLKSEVEAGRGHIQVFFDTEGRKANCHMVAVNYAGYQGSDKNPGDDKDSDIFIMTPDWTSGEMT